MNILAFWCVLFMLLLNVSSSSEDETKIYIVYMGERAHEEPEHLTTLHLQMLEAVLGSEKAAQDSMIYSYRHGFSGFAAHLTDSQAKTISKHQDVVQVTQNTFYKPQTTRTFQYLGLSQTDPTGLLLEAKMGEDIIIGVIDSGVWPESESFNDRGLGPIPARWKGKCVDGEMFDGKIHCNRKLIGARYYTSLFHKNGTDKVVPGMDYMSAREGMWSYHGTHVASTAGGTFVTNASYKGFAQGTVRGGAPRARIAVYKVCWNYEGIVCSMADILMAIDDGIRDGVSLISISIGPDMPLRSETELGNMISYGSFHAISKGIPVVCAAGNDGPKAYTVNNIAPWIITVGATTLDRWFPTPLLLGNNVTLMAAATYKGQDFQADLIFVESQDNITSAAKGKVILFFPTDDDTTKFMPQFQAAGAKAVLIASRRRGDFEINEGSAKSTFLLMIGSEQATTIMKYIDSTSLPTIKIRSAITVTGPLIATFVPPFSSRGPNSVSPHVLKPDIVAPGVGILAASPPQYPLAENGFMFDSGTSMSAPVVAGVVALLRAVHPDWSPAVIRSALVTTASTTDPYGEPIFADGVSHKLADPFDFGGGLVNPNKVADPGLIYDAGVEDYLHYLCASGQDEASITKIANKTLLYRCPSPKPSIFNLNLPSITIPFLDENVTITRTVTNVGPVNSVYEVHVVAPFGVDIHVTPKVLLFNSSVKQLSFEVRVSSTHRTNSVFYFGSLTWTDFSHHVTIPLSVRRQILKYFEY